MSTASVQNSNPISSITNTPIGNSSTDIMAYAESLLVQDYNEQMKNMATNIKTTTKLKEAYRMHKTNINDLLSKNANKDGEVTLTAAEYDLLNSKPTYTWDQSLHNDAGGVQTFDKNGDPVAAVSNENYARVDGDASTIVAANQTTSWHGDPHFVDADGGTWDFQGAAGQTYNYLDELNLHMTATHQAASGNATVVGQVNIQLNGPNGDSNLVFKAVNANSKPTLNGTVMKVGQVYKTEDGGSAVYNGSVLSVTSGEGYQIALTNTGSYLNGRVTTPKNGTQTDGVAAQGVVGQTFDANTNAAFTNKADSEAANAGFATTAPGQQNTDAPKTYKVKVDVIKTELERLQMKMDGLNSDTEMAQTELSTVTSQRKLAFETMSTMLAKVFEGASTVVRNVK